MGFDVKFIIEKAVEDYKGTIQSWGYTDRDFIRYIKENYRGLINKEEKSELFRLYQKYNLKAKGRRGRLQKYPFFIYWLIIKLNGEKEVLDYIEENLSGSAKNQTNKRANKTNFQDKIDHVLKKKRIIEECLKNERLDGIYKGAIEGMKEQARESIEAAKVARAVIQDYIAEHVRNEKIIRKLIKYVENGGPKTQREISRKFSLTLAELFPVLSMLESRGVVIWDKKEKRVSLK